MITKQIKEKEIFIKDKTKVLTYILMMIFFIKGIVYATYIVPPMMGMAPDDIGHFSYIQYLALERKLPVLNETTMEEIPLLSFTESKKGIFSDQKLNDYFHSTNKNNWIIQHPPLYYLLLTPFYLITTYFTKKLAKTLVILRIITVLFGVLTIYIIFKILQDLKTNFYVNSCILFSFVFSPAIQYYFSNVTNDSLLIFLCTLALFFLIHFFTTKNKKFFFFFVISSACIILTKYTGGLILIGYILLFLVWQIKNQGLKETLFLSVQGLIIGIVIIAPYFYHNFLLYGNIFWPENVISPPPKSGLSFTKFFIESKYFDKIYQNICILIGWTNNIGANYFVMLYNAIIIAFSGCLFQKEITNKFYKLLIISISTLSFILSYTFLDLNLSTSIVIGASLSIGLSLLYQNDINKIINFGLYISILIVFLIYLYQHFNIYLDYGYLKALNGRYYYIIFFPVTYLIFLPIKNIRIKFQRLFSISYLICQMGYEIWAINHMILGLL